MYQNNRMTRGRGGFRGNRGGRARGFNRGGHPPWGYNRGGNTFQHRGNRNNANQQWRNKPRDTPGKRLSEEEIGVTEYICKDLGFNGIIKHRFSDFQVSEINEQGEVAKLTDLSIPKKVVEEEIEDSEEFLLNKYNLEILPMETWDKINNMVVSNSTDDVDVDVTGMTKDQRTKIHESVKKAFGAGIVGSTETRAEQKFVVFKRYRAGIRIDRRIKWTWPGDFVHFIVYKENCDTMEAATQIANRLDAFYIKPSAVGYAGTKDRRAKTSQWFSLRRIDPTKIARACQNLKDIKAGNFKFSDKHLKLGNLKGNKFRIALRNVTSEDDVIAESCKSLREKGFINYYGLQRFGTRLAVPTFAIGLHLYQKNFKEAIKAILQEKEGSMYDALLAYKTTGDAEYAFSLVRKYDQSTTEAKLLRALAGAPNDFCGAMNRVPRNIRLLYLHSYQSLVWNQCVSERLKRFSHKLAVGDLVVQQTEDINLDLEHNEVESDDEENAETDDAKELDTETTEPNDSNPPDDQYTLNDNEEWKLKNSKERRNIPVKVLSQEDIDSGAYSMFDVVMPLPGFDVVYPEHMKEFYEELAKKDKVDLNVKNNHKSYNVAGAYRYVLARPFDLEWRCVRYNDPYGDLILSDKDEMENQTHSTIVPDGKYKALLLTMSLPTSCYATMALRELLKSDTSGDHQASQNNYFRNDDKNVENSKNGSEKRKGEEKDEIESKKSKLDDIDTNNGIEAIKIEDKMEIDGNKLNVETDLSTKVEEKQTIEENKEENIISTEEVKEEECDNVK